MTHRNELCRKEARSALERGYEARRAGQRRGRTGDRGTEAEAHDGSLRARIEGQLRALQRGGSEGEGTHDEPAPDDARRAAEAEGRVERGHDGRGDTVGGRGGSAWCGAGGGGEGAASGSGPAVALAPTRPGPRRCRRGADVPHDRECERDGLQGGRSMVSSTSPSGSEGESDNDGH